VPELPDVTVYIERLTPLVLAQPLVTARLPSPFVLRTVDPPIREVEGKTVTGIRRLGKRIVLALEGELFIVIHLMIAGRLRWRGPGRTLKGKMVLAEFSFPDGTLYLTEAGSKRRASIHVVRGEAALTAFERGGLEVLGASLAEFSQRLRSENHTLKRSLTDPRLMSGIGNAYSDEILHRAKLSPLMLSSRIDDEQVARLFEAMRSTLIEWTDRLRAEAGSSFPEKVTAFHDEMAVHGRFRKPCPVCGAPVQRIRYAENETNYCARCQTGGRVLADRSLSRLLKDDWPRNIDEWEA
jgi:formamidopyrimidine-DNA glycosylase